MRAATRIAVTSALLMGLVAAAPAWAGQANAVLRCEPDGERDAFALEGEVPGSFPREFKLTLSGRGEMRSYDGQGGRIDVVSDLPVRVFTLVVHQAAETLSLYAVPAGMRITKLPNGIQARFRAVVEVAPDPTGDRARLRARMRCTYRYTI